MSEKFFVRPVLCVRSVEASLAYYCEKLGFSKNWDHAGSDGLIIAEVGRDEISVILDCGSVLPRPATPSVLSVSVDKPETLAELHREFTDRGARVGAPFAVVWQKNINQMDVEDLDGNILMFWADKPS
jgi:hypothetical protein